MTNTSDQPIAEREKAERLFRAHYGDLLKFARRRTGNDELARDVVGSTFLTAWRRRDVMPTEERSQLFWLYAVARNEIGTHLRTQGRAAALTNRIRSNARSAPPFAQLDRPVEEESALAEAFNSLAAADREVLSLHAWEGLGAAEAAQVLGCSTNAYSIRLHRARSRLQARLTNDSWGSSSKLDSTSSHAPVARTDRPEPRREGGC